MFFKVMTNHLCPLFHPTSFCVRSEVGRPSVTLCLDSTETSNYLSYALSNFLYPKQLE